MISRDDGPGADDAPLPQVGALQNDGSTSDKAIIADGDWASLSRGISPLIFRYIEGVKVGIDYQRSGADEDAVTDADRGFTDNRTTTET